ncbi:MAG: hypothetical protein D6736_01225 [Nitrospinota bacterium]|nr:MAG: hypothetical protein D6736_01225 [Nitrospinota bacterium]
MYIRPENRELIFKGTPGLERETCMECGKEAVIIWEPAEWGVILLCGECAQTIGVQLLKDVRSYEMDNHLSVKIQSQTTPRAPGQ